jgi:hypothetical protein
MRFEERLDFAAQHGIAGAQTIDQRLASVRGTFDGVCKNLLNLLPAFGGEGRGANGEAHS